MHHVMTDRRRFLIGSLMAAIPAALLTACASTGSSSAVVQAQIVADVKGLEGVVTALMTAINASAPGAISADDQATIAKDEAVLEAAVNALSGATPIGTGATLLEQIDNGLNGALGIIGAALPALAVAYPAVAGVVPVYNAAVALLPVLEAYINSIIVQINPAAPPVASAHRYGAVSAKRGVPAISLTPKQARDVLHIPTV